VSSVQPIVCEAFASNHPGGLQKGVSLKQKKKGKEKKQKRKRKKK